MGKSWKVALALGVGYFLGRTHKTRLALVLAAGAATGGFGGAARRIVTSGGKRLAASESLGKLSPDFGPVVDSLKGDLAEAGKAAAKAAIGSKLDAVADSLHVRTEALRAEPGAGIKSGIRSDIRTDEDRPEGRQERRPRPEAESAADRDRGPRAPRRAPRPRPSDDSAAPRPRSSAHDRPDRPARRQPASSRAGQPGRPGSGYRDGSD